MLIKNFNVFKPVDCESWSRVHRMEIISNKSRVQEKEESEEKYHPRDKYKKDEKNSQVGSKALTVAKELKELRNKV